MQFPAHVIRETRRAFQLLPLLVEYPQNLHSNVYKMYQRFFPRPCFFIGSAASKNPPISNAFRAA